MANIILIVLLIGGWFWGYKAGLIKLLSSFGAFLGAILVSSRISPNLAENFNLDLSFFGSVDSGNEILDALMLEAIANMVVGFFVFIVVFIISVFVLRILANFLGSVINSIPLIGTISRLAGGILGVLIIVVLIYAFSGWVFPMLDLTEATEFIDDATLVTPIVYQIGDSLFNMVDGQLTLKDILSLDFSSLDFSSMNLSEIFENFENLDVDLSDYGIDLDSLDLEGLNLEDLTLEDLGIDLSDFDIDALLNQE